MRIGYARTSTTKQELQPQIDALEEAGCQKIFTDFGESGAKAFRPGLEDALSFARSDDLIVVVRLDRLGRSLKNLIHIVALFEQRHLHLLSLNEAIDTSTSTGRLVFGIFASLAEFERSLIRERTLAGLAAAKRQGRTGGRPRVLSDDDRKIAVNLIESTHLSMKQVAAHLGCSISTLYRVLPGGKSASSSLQ